MGINLFVASSLQELEQIDVSGVVGSGEEIVDILAETWWGVTMYVASETKIYKIDTEYSSSVTSSRVLFGK